MDILDFYGVADLLTAELGRPIAYIEVPEAWRTWRGPAIRQLYGETAEDYFVHHFTWEADMTFTRIEREIGGAAGELARQIFESGPRRLRDTIIRNMLRRSRKSPVKKGLLHG